MKWCESTKWSRSKASKTWFCRSMRKTHCSKDRGSLKSMKINLLKSSKANNSRGRTSCRPWRRRLKRKEMRYSRSWLPRKLHAELNTSISRTCVTIFKCKSKRREPGLRNKQKGKKDTDKNKNCRLPKITKWNSRPKDSQKKREWRTSSNARWPRSLRRTKD